jgi:hypothetical protein
VIEETIDTINTICAFLILSELSILCFIVGWIHRYEMWGEYTAFGFMGIIGTVLAILVMIGVINYFGSFSLPADGGL